MQPLPSGKDSAPDFTTCQAPDPCRWNALFLRPAPSTARRCEESQRAWDLGGPRRVGGDWRGRGGHRSSGRSCSSDPWGHGKRVLVFVKPFIGSNLSKRGRAKKVSNMHKECHTLCLVYSPCQSQATQTVLAELFRVPPNEWWHVWSPT